MGGQHHVPVTLTPERPGIILQEARWSSGPVSTEWKVSTHGDSNPDRPARSESLCRLSYPGRHLDNDSRNKWLNHQHTLQTENPTNCTNNIIETLTDLDQNRNEIRKRFAFANLGFLSTRNLVPRTLIPAGLHDAQRYSCPVRRGAMQ